MHRRLIYVLALVCLLGSRPALAWGPRGHQVVAIIAQDLVSAHTRALLARFAPDGLAAEANWADVHRNSTTQPWHYVDLEIDETVTLGSIHGYARDNVVREISRQAALLKSAPDDEARLRALRYLVHFVGDIHQPLHCADAHDRGGNDADVSLEGRRMTLHRAWDRLLLKYPSRIDPRIMATRLEHLYSDRDRRTWAAQTDPAQWALESYHIARNDIYPAYRKDAHLTPAYCQRHQPLINRRLYQAGVRLAHLLDACLSGAESR